jgi:flagellar hook-length control protein FliK
MNITNMHDNGADQRHAAGCKEKMKPAAVSAPDRAPAGMSGDISNVNSGREKATDDSGVSPFQRIYNEIAQCNINAQKNNGAKNGTESADAATTDDQNKALAELVSSELLKQLGVSEDADLQQQILGMGTDTNSFANLTAEAAAIIRDAIAAITKTLNLKIQDGLDNLTSITPTQAIVDQFAEMLSTLKGIAGVLDESVNLNQPLEYKELAFDVAGAAKAQQVIREQMFKIEIALKMMGISGDVAASMAQKDGLMQDAVATLTGIPQATDPSKLSMPVIHVKQVLGELFVSKEQKVETLLTKLAETLKKSGDPDASALLTKIASAATGDADKAKAADSNDIGQLDSQVLRKILKVDAAQATETENKNAAKQNVAMDLPKQGKVMTSTTITDMVQHPKTADNTTVFQGQDSLATQGVDKLFNALRTNETGTMRQLEQSVVQQVADKLNVAMKTGITEIRVMLRPESLGEVQLKIRVEGDVVMGKMYVENQQVKHIVEANLQALKDSLSQHNLTVGSFSVDINHGNDAQEQMRDMAQMATHANDGDENGSGRGDAEKGKDSDGNTIASGIETGRKYGTNTIEYFA